MPALHPQPPPPAALFPSLIKPPISPPPPACPSHVCTVCRSLSSSCCCQWPASLPASPHSAQPPLCSPPSPHVNHAGFLAAAAAATGALPPHRPHVTAALANLVQASREPLPPPFPPILCIFRVRRSPSNSCCCLWHASPPASHRSA
jgi:hypothetical protein